MLLEIPWRELFEAVYRQRRIVVLGTLVFVGLAGLSVWLEPSVFRATARIQLTADAASEPRAAAMSDKQLQAELAFLRSPALISRVLSKLDAAKGEAQSGSGMPSLLSGGELPRSDLLEQRVRAAARKIEVEPIGRSNLVEIAYLSSNPVFAADFVNGLLSEHVERISELGKESPELPFIESQLGGLLERWQESRRELDAFRSRYGASVLGGDEQQLRALVTSLESQRVATETNVFELRARVEHLESQKAAYPVTVESELRVAEPEAVTALKARIMELQMQRSEAITRYTPTSVVVRQLDQQIAEAERLLGTKSREVSSEVATVRNPAVDALEVEQLRTRTSLRATEARIQALSDQIASYRHKLSLLEEAAVEQQSLQEEVDSAQQAYQQALREAETARKESARDEFGMVNIAIIDAAEPPRVALPGRRKIKLAGGGLLGVVLSIAVALLRDWLNPTVKSAAQTRRLTGQRVLTEIPYQ